MTTRSLLSHALALLVGLLVAGGVGLYAVRQERAKTEVAEAEARESARRADANAARVLKAELAGAAEVALAEANYRLARKAVDDSFSVASDHPLLRQGEMRGLRRALLEKVLVFYLDYHPRRPGEPEALREEADRHDRVAFILQELGNAKEAEAARKQAEWARKKADALKKRLRE
jgi:hypothetical protein